MSRVGVSTPSEASANEELARAGLGLWESHQRTEGAGPRPFFREAPSEGRRRRRAAAGRRWKHSRALFAETRRLLLHTGAVRVRRPSTSYQEGKIVAAQRRWYRCRSGTLCPRGPSPAVGRRQQCDLAPGSAGLAPGHQVALSWRRPLCFLVMKKAI